MAQAHHPMTAHSPMNITIALNAGEPVAHRTRAALEEIPGSGTPVVGPQPTQTGKNNMFF